MFLRSIHFIFLFCLLFVSIFFNTPPAQGETLLEISPLVVDEKLKARESYSSTITLTNNSSVRMNLYASVNNVRVGPDGGVETFTAEGNRRDSLANWIEISRGVIQLNAGETKEIDFSINAGPRVEPGRYHALVFFSPGSNRAEAESRVTRDGAVMMNLEIEEDIIELLQMKRFSPVQNFFTDGEARFIYVLENTGNRAVTPTGEMIIYNRRGAEVGAVGLESDRAVQPGEEESFEVSWKGSGSRYRAHLSVEYGSRDKKTITDSVYFTIFPLIQVLALFAVMLVLIVLFVYYWHNRQVKRHKQHVDELVRQYHAGTGHEVLSQRGPQVQNKTPGKPVAHKGSHVVDMRRMEK
jgi:hypothetical protein